MTIVKRAVLKQADAPTVYLSLFRVERGVYRWVCDTDGQPWGGIDYLDEASAIKAARVWAETDPAAVGVDLTVLPVTPPPEERAAVRIDKSLDELGHLSIDEITEIIRNETAIDKLVESTNVLLAYLVQRIRQPRPAGLDITQAGLILEVVAALERAQDVDLSNIRRRLTENVESVKIYSAMPPSGGGIVQ